MSLLRCDGFFVVYQLEMFNGKKWHGPNYDVFGYPPEVEKHDGFTASGDCWQQTGLHGSFEPVVGREALTGFRRKHPELTLRLVRRVVLQDTTVVSAETGDGL